MDATYASIFPRFIQAEYHIYLSTGDPTGSHRRGLSRLVSIFQITQGQIMAVNFALFSGHLCNFQAAKSMHKLPFRAIIHTRADQERNHILLLHHIQTHSLID